MKEDGMDCFHDDYGKRYTVHLEVFSGDEMHVKAFQTYFDIRKPEEKQWLLDRIAAKLAQEVGKEMFQTYRPSAVAELHGEYIRARNKRAGGMK